MKQGLSPMNAPSETVIAFSCAPGEATLDETGNNRNGIFTEKLLKHIAIPNKDIEEVLKLVSRDVKLQTGGYQKPYRTSSLTEDVFLATNHSQEQIQTRKDQYQQFGITVAGGNRYGQELNQLSQPQGMFIDNDKSIYIVDQWNHRIVKWKLNSKTGQIIAGGNGNGNQNNQLNCPTDIIFDKENNSFTISELGHRRVVRYFDQNQTNQPIIILNINCWGLTIDRNGFIYLSDLENHEVRRWKQGDKNGELVAGGNGQGDHLNQLNQPTYIFIDDDYSLYISDRNNHRVMKWKKDAKEG
ncbi:unnamed protein product, partial [Adineta steineri]